MSLKAYFSEKLSNLVFLTVKKEKVKEIFKVCLDEDIYIPIRSSEMINGIKNGEDFDKVPGTMLLEGMFYVLGADSKFLHNKYYIEIIRNIPESLKFIKGKIASEIKNANYEEAYIFLKGLLNLEKTKENYDKSILLLEHLRSIDKMYFDEEREVLEEAKEINDYANPYLYEGILEKDEGDYVKALYFINIYLSKGGEKSTYVQQLIESLDNSNHYDKGKELMYDNPKEALKIFLPLLEKFEDDAILYYYIGVCYRVLNNNEKAIYYLNESLRLDGNLVEVVNELGLNYASLGNYETAVLYLRKAFEATKAIEICTNLVMCYLNLGNLEQAKLHLDIAEKIKSNDEVVLQLKEIIKQ